MPVQECHFIVENGSDLLIHNGFLSVYFTGYVKGEAPVPLPNQIFLTHDKKSADIFLVKGLPIIIEPNRIPTELEGLRVHYSAMGFEELGQSKDRSLFALKLKSDCATYQTVRMNYDDEAIG